MMKNLIKNKIDMLIQGFDAALRSLFPPNKRVHKHASPAQDMEHSVLQPDEICLSARLMRVNHSGEICAQALYLGQAFTARTNMMQDYLYEAFVEETEHLAWCEQRLQALNHRVSYLNPVWYVAAWVLGACSGLLGDRISLGFVHAIEQQVGLHLEAHLHCLPLADQQSYAILMQMKQDEARHASDAIQRGGVIFPDWIQRWMLKFSKIMTKSSYYI